MRKDLEREERRKLETSRNELRRDLEARDRSAQRKYESLLREYQNNVEKDVLDAKLAMDEEYRKLLRASREAEREWSERSRQMEETARKLKSDAAVRERVGSDEAAKTIDLAAKTYTGVEQTPHELFFPKRLKIFFDAIKEAAGLHKIGLNEAAAAISISTRSGIERLGYDVKDKQEEWMETFSLFKARVGLLHLRLEGEVLDWIRLTDDGRNVKKIKDLSAEERRRREVEIDYWSKGAYRTTRRGVDAFGGLIARIEKMGVNSYLKSDGAVGLEALRADIAETDRLSDAWNEVCDLYKARYAASCQRAQWGKSIVRFLSDEIDLVWRESESGYREAEGETGETFKEYAKIQYGDENVTEDTREWLELVFENAAGTQVFLYIVPEEMKGEVNNHVLLYVDRSGSVTDDFAREITLHVLESLNMSEEDGVVTLFREISQLALSPDASLRSTGRALEKKLAPI
jgi:hypothetical protein